MVEIPARAETHEVETTTATRSLAAAQAQRSETESESEDATGVGTGANARGSGDSSRGARLAEGFVALADALTDQFDETDQLHLLANHCVEFAGVRAAGVLLTNEQGELAAAAATSQTAEKLANFEVQTGQGPSVVAVATGRPVACVDLADGADRWPLYARRASALGMVAVTAVPLRLRQQAIGALALFPVARLDETGQRIAQALADVAVIGILAERAVREGQQVTQQLQTALTNRVAIEQAKGKLSHFGGVTTDDAFRALRAYGRNHNRRLSELALEVLNGRVSLREILDTASPR